LSGIGRFGLVLFGLNDGVGLERPVQPGSDRELLYLRTFDESVLTVMTSEGDSANPRFGKPKTYSIDFTTSTHGIESTNTLMVDWSRCVHLADNRRMDEVYGVSRMREVFNRLQDLRKLMGGSAEMFWQGAFPGLAFEVDPRLLEEGAIELDTDALKEQMQDYVNGLQRWLSTAGVSVKTLAPIVSDPTSHIEVQLKAIAITLGVPYRVFTGTEEGKLAGGQDAAAWAKRLKRRQEKYLTPYVIRPFIERLIAVGVLPEPAELNIRWPDMLTPSEKEKADVAKTITEALKAYVQGDVNQALPLSFYLTEILGMESEQVDSILEQVYEEQAAEQAEEEERQRLEAEALEKENKLLGGGQPPAGDNKVV